MDLGASLIKYCLCLFNFVFVIFGTALLALGIWLIADITSLIYLLKLASQDQIRVSEYGPATVLEQAGYVFIALGTFIFIISFLGYCGTMKESRFLLGAYAFFLTVIFILEIIVVVLFVVYRTETESESKNILMKSIQKMYSTRENATPFTVTADVVMRGSQCCGVNNFTDFKYAEMYTKNSTFPVPVACCKPKTNAVNFEDVEDACRRGENGQPYIHVGCFQKLVDTLKSEMNIAIAVAVAIGLLQIIGIVFTFCVYKASNYEYK